MKNLKEKQFLVNMALSLGQVPDPALVKEIREHKELMELNWDIFYGREEGVHDVKKENELRKQVETAQKKMEQLQGFLQAKKES